MYPVQHGTQTSIEKNIFQASLVNRRNEIDVQESSIIMRALKEHISQHANDDIVSLSEIVAPRTAGSTLDIAQQPFSSALAKFKKNTAFITMQQVYEFSSDPVMFVDMNASLRVFKEGTWINLTHDFQTKHYLQDDLQIIAEGAEQTGGFVFTGEFIGIQQWLVFHKYTIPKTVSDIKNLIAFLEFKIPASPDTGDYRELLMEPLDSPFHLSNDDRQIIRTVIAETTQGRNSLLQHIAPKNFSTFPEDIRREHAGFYLNSFMKKPNAKKLGRALLERLEWYVETDDPQATERQLKCMVATALILDLMPQMEKQAGEIAGYAFYQPDNALRTAPEILKEVENHLIAEKMIESHNAQLAAHLLLAGIAPEFLVQGTPVELTIDRPGWVVFAQAVALVELTAPGASRLMNYEEVKSFSDLAPVSKAQLTLHELTAIKPIIHWAMLNGVLPYSRDSDYSTESYAKAASSFGLYAKALNQIETGISANPPNRRELALSALKRVMPAGDYLEQRVYKLNYPAALNEKSWIEFLASFNLVYLWDDAAVLLGVDEYAVSKVHRLRASILDLYMSGDLVVNRRFNHRFVSTKTLAIPKDAFSRLSELEPVDKLFNDAFDPYYHDLQKGLSSVIKMAITQLPEDSRTFLSNGYVTLYTVRKEANSDNAFQETQRQRDDEKGRYGIILGCLHDNEFRCFELFTLKGLCRERPDLADQLRSSGIADSTPSLSYTGADTDFQAKNPERQWPVDASAYLDGSHPKRATFSRVVVEKLWHFHLQSDDVRPVPLFFSSALDKLAEEVLTCHPIATREELYALLNTQTDLQKMRSQKDALDTALVNIVIPFKKCIEDIGSGDAPRVAEGVGGCVLDGLALLGLVVGFGATVAGIVGKTASTTSKVLSIAKAGARFSASLVNPFDGLPDLVVQGTRLLRKGALFLSKHGLNALETATGQLRKLTGNAQSYDLVKAAELYDLRQGAWKGADDLGEPISLLAFKHHQDWYAIHPRTRLPGGRALKNFRVTDDLARLPGLHRIIPKSYARSVIKNALPIARRKLDFAIDTLSKGINDRDIRFLLKAFFGSDSDEVAKAYRDAMRVMRDDLDNLAISNIKLDNAKASEAIAGLFPDNYRAWKAAVQADQPHEQFMVVFTDALNDYYRQINFDDSGIADIFVHELSHGGPATHDFFYADISKRKALMVGDLEVSGLLNLAKGPEHVDGSSKLAGRGISILLNPPRGEPLPFINEAPGFLNADSHTMVTSLLSQSVTNNPAFQSNLGNLRAALKSSGNRPITTPVRLSLGQGSVPSF
ncbi:hypothetical protein [Pseudomonas gozinkensis]|uniref:hypothetical protein n=1 Tax=Pseudomonas gozinkensis TaxID=2774461 RepID=UPI001788283D|nr:hypothetical protein [Pseudomonas gozinkensis]